MRTRVVLTALGSVLAVALAALTRAPEVAAQAPAPPSAPPSSINGQRPACVTVTQASLFNGTGYNHLVTVANACDRPVSCTVTTSVNPDPRAVTVAPQRSEMVNTFLGSPSATFTPTVQCRLN